MSPKVVVVVVVVRIEKLHHSFPLRFLGPESSSLLGVTPELVALGYLTIVVFTSDRFSQGLLLSVPYCFLPLIVPSQIKTN